MGESRKKGLRLSGENVPRTEFRVSHLAHFAPSWAKPHYAGPFRARALILLPNSSPLHALSEAKISHQPSLLLTLLIIADVVVIAATAWFVLSQ